ncbi:MAG: (d)CMP kinase [Lachnospiraceae bacterium]|nr:(d)CMP kinase [Lachnospiraceae bacterium]
MGHTIAIDGPAGAGKSTIARTLAKDLGFMYIDTGAMYRAMGLFMLENEVDLSHPDEIAKASSGADINIDYEGNKPCIYLNGKNVTDSLRSEAVSDAASRVAAVHAVRERLVKRQRELAESRDVIMEGRDIGTKVLPMADVKFFLTASPEKRAERRYKELRDKGVECTLEEIRKDIEERDERDTHRTASPLVQADDAVYVDTSDMTIDEAMEYMISYCF